MNEFKENNYEIPEIREFQQSLETSAFSFEALMNEVNTFLENSIDFSGEVLDIKETINAREYGLRECADAAKEAFTPEIFAEWGSMSPEQRQQIVQDYSTAIGEGLNIDFKGVVFEPLIDQMGALGYNSGDGYIHLDYSYITDPSRIVGLVDTVAHEARHQFQYEAIQNPEKFGIDQETINEWTVGMSNYTEQYATVYDPWGYHYNPVEIDARYFGESLVRELTKDLINNSINEYS